MRYLLDPQLSVFDRDLGEMPDLDSEMVGHAMKVNKSRQRQAGTPGQ